MRTQLEEDYELIENEGLFDEYLEMGVYILSMTFVGYSTLHTISKN